MFLVNFPRDFFKRYFFSLPKDSLIFTYLTIFFFIEDSIIT